jgi:hypothetical protein
MTITTEAAEIFRDMDSPGSSVPHEPEKAEIRALFATVDDEIQDFADIVLSGRLEYESWLLLSAVVTTAGVVGAVNPVDTGTHTDPVVGGTVPNSGVYRYSVSPAGWRRIGAYRALEVATLAEVNTGTDTAKAVTPDTLKDTWWTDRERIRCAVMDSPAPTSGAVSLKPINATTRLSGTAAQYIFEFQCPVTKGVGAYQATLYQADGTTLFTGPFAILDNLGAALPTAGILEGDWVEFGRNAALTQYNMLHRPDTASVLLANSLVTTTLKSPKPERPVSTLQIGTNLSLLRVRMPISAYADATLANQEDYMQIAYMNVADAMSLGSQAPDGCYALNSLTGHVRNQNVVFSNFVFTALDSGTTFETGVSWSAFEGVLMALNMAAPSHAELRGIAHGPISDVTSERRGYRQDSSTGKITAATKTNPLTLTIGTITAAQIGDRIRPTGVVGMTQINDVWLTISGISYVGNTSVLTFAGVNATGYGTFISNATNIEWEKILDPALNEEWNGIRIEQSQSYWLKTPAGPGNVPPSEKWAYRTDLMTFEPGADYVVKFEWQADFTHPDITIDPGTKSGGYAWMNPCTGVNRSAGIVNGVQGVVKNVDTRVLGAVIGFGNADVKVDWNVDFGDVQLVITNIAGPGFTHFEDSGSGPVGVAYGTPVISIQNDYGSKDYCPIYPSATPVSLAGKILTGGAKYNLVRRPALT